ncbi:MAG: dihydrodipicolinate reductase C-terminal domain-containing protein [Bacteroidales bacterium]|nr:dihydrodipicolinate reductase C-terminal domain-containing protein [Bacteroidales bacterium]
MKVFISGYGRMGKMVEAVLKEKGIECAGWSENIAEVDASVAKDCVCVDFTVPDAFRANYGAIAGKFKAVVVGTTGWYDIKDEVFSCFGKCGTPLIWASNFSVGVNVFSAAVALASRLLAKAGGYAPYIVEKHHCHKLDAPSGTAKTIASDIQSNMGIAPDVASIRVGELAGTHTVGFEGGCDRLTFEHEAFSRQGFAEGAVLAAVMADGIAGKAAAGEKVTLVNEFRDLFLETK